MISSSEYIFIKVYIYILTHKKCVTNLGKCFFLLRCLLRKIQIPHTELRIIAVLVLRAFFLVLQLFGVE